MLLLVLVLLLLLLLLLSTNGGARPRSASASCERKGLAAVVSAGAGSAATVDSCVHLLFLFRSDAFITTSDGALERRQAKPHRDHRRGRALEARLAPVAGVEGARHERARAGADAGIGRREERLRRGLHPGRGEAGDILRPGGPGAYFFVCVRLVFFVCVFASVRGREWTRAREKEKEKGIYVSALSFLFQLTGECDPVECFQR